MDDICREDYWDVTPGDLFPPAHFSPTKRTKGPCFPGVDGLSHRLLTMMF